MTFFVLAAQHEGRDTDRLILAARHDVSSKEAVQELDGQVQAGLPEAELEMDLDQPIDQGLSHVRGDLLHRGSALARSGAS